MKVLNLYAGIGGNRKLWRGVDVVAVENNKHVAAIYQEFFPDDFVLVMDAHKYLLDHHKEFDFIWSSPPCPTHTVFNFLNNIREEQGIQPKYPDMKLYEEILFLKYWFKGKWVVENVKSYYDPLILPQVSGRHYFWTNFWIDNLKIHNKVRNDKDITLEVKMRDMNIIVKNFHNYKKDKRTLLNNCIEPELGLDIFKAAFKNKQLTIA